MITGVLALLGAMAWWSTARQVGDMSGMGDMVDGLSAVGVAMMPFPAAVFMAMWITMMVAMMLPTVAPIVLLHRMVMRRRGVGLVPTAAFVGGYVTAWAAAGLVPLAALLAFRSATDNSGWIAPVAGFALIVAGLYQFSGWKKTCQRACQSPLTFLSTHDFGSGVAGAVRAGVTHGLYCLGCCWALMTVLFVVGLMNLTWMALIAIVFLIEKHWRHALAFARVVGSGVALLGAGIVVNPSLLPAVAGL
jgi:predicted metal-binding membrane protein